MYKYHKNIVNPEKNRLYREEDYEKLPDATPPEIQRTNLLSVVLQLKALGIDNILRFNFPNPPPARNLLSALELLFALHAIDERGELIHPHGATMAEFALDPLYSKVLLVSGIFYNKKKPKILNNCFSKSIIGFSGEYGCSEEILSIISMLQVENVFTKPSSGQASIRARIQKRNFEVEEGDLITLLNVFTGFINNNMAKDYSHRNFINYKAMKRVVDIRHHIGKMMKKYNIPMIKTSKY